MLNRGTSAWLLVVIALNFMRFDMSHGEVPKMFLGFPPVAAGDRFQSGQMEPEDVSVILTETVFNFI